MPLRRVPPQLANFVAGFLEIIFSQNRHPSSDGSPHARAVHGLARRHQAHGSRVATSPQGRLSHAFLHARHILCYRKDFICIVCFSLEHKLDPHA